jgi:type VI secretion system secreted protein Hcp
MALVDYFLKIADIKGESLDSKHRDEIEVESWSWGLTNAATGPGGGQAGRPNFTDFSFVKRLDKASPQLALASASGKHFPEVTLTGRRASGKPSFEYLQVKLSDVQITSYQSAGPGTEAFPSDSFSFSFSKIDFAYSMQKEDGSADAPVRMVWDLKANKKV